MKILILCNDKSFGCSNDVLMIGAFSGIACARILVLHVKCVLEMQMCSNVVDVVSQFTLQVGDGDSDHLCWQRPEDMTTSRQCYAISPDRPGSDLAGETAAGMAAASIAFRSSNPSYADELLFHARQVRMPSCTESRKMYIEHGLQYFGFG